MVLPEETASDEMTRAGDERLWTVVQCADYLQLSVSWVYKHIDEIPHAMLGHSLRFQPARVREYAAQQIGSGSRAKVIPLRKCK